MLAKRQEMQRKLFETIHPGDTVEGTVKNITDFGAFVDLDGMDGLQSVFGAGDRGRTDTVSLPQDFESSASKLFF